MHKPKTSNSPESASPHSALRFNNITPRKPGSRKLKLKTVNSPKLNLKKLDMATGPASQFSPREGSQGVLSPMHLSKLQPVQSVHLSPREMSLSKILRTEPDRSQTLAKIDLSQTTKEFKHNTITSRSGHGLMPLSVRSPRRLATDYSRGDTDSSQDEPKVLVANFSRFNNYLESLKRSESRKSPLAKETFYYPEQVEMNRKFKIQEREMKSLDEKGLFHFRTMREGKKEKIRLPIGTKTYLKINCVGKAFPLQVKVETKLGTFQIMVSKNYERPDRQNCDYYFSQAYFEITYSNPEKIKNLYFHVMGTGNMELCVTMNFSESEPETRVSNLIKSHVFGYKPLVSPNRYEIFHENMTREEVNGLKEMVDEIKKERLQKIQSQSRDIINDNFSMVTDYSKTKTEQQAELIQKRDFTLFKNREKRAHLVERKKLKQMCDLIKTDVQRVSRNWRMQKDTEIHRELTFQKSWLVLMALAFMGREILERKRVVLAFRVINMIKDQATRRIQRMVRNYLIGQRQVKTQSQEEIDGIDQHEELNTNNISRALNAVASQWRQIQKQKAGKIVANLFRDYLFAMGITKAVKKYSVKVGKIQKKWKQKQEVVNARVDIFLTCWNEYCGMLLSESKAKNKLLNAFGKIKEQQIVERGKQFVRGRMGNPKSINFVIDAFKNPKFVIKNLPVVAPPIPNEKSPKGSQGKKNGGARGSLLHLSQTSISETQNQGKSKLVPSMSELKEIFDSIIHEVQLEENINAPKTERNEPTK